MRDIDRQAFDVQIEQLFGAFPSVPLTDQRRTAYWRGLAEMAIEMLERCVMRAIAAKGEERIPSVSRLWEISRELRVRSDSPSDARRPSVQYLLNCYVLAHFALTRPQLAQAWEYLSRGNPHTGSSEFEITGVIVPALDNVAAIRVMVSDLDLDAVWQAEQARVADLHRQRAAHHAQPLTVQGVLPALPAPPREELAR